MKKIFFFPLVIITILLGFTLVSCSDDDDPIAPPTLQLTEVNSTGKSGDEVSVQVTITTDAAFESLVVTKLYDGMSQGTQEFTQLAGNSFTYTYTIEDSDADNILSFNFLLTDASGQKAERDWIVTVELTSMQLLLKYDWRLSEEIRKTTNMGDIAQAYVDDVYRFNEDGTYQKNNGGTLDDFGDSWFNYCQYDLDESTMRLLMTRTGAFGEDVRDTLDITLIDETQLLADVTYRGLDVFNTGDESVPYEAVEEYEKQFVAVPKPAEFDPYGPGADDDAGPAMNCIEVTFDN